MVIHVFSSSKKSESWFSAFSKSRKNTLEFHPREEIRPWCKKHWRGEIVYVDIQGLSPKEISGLLKHLSSLTNGSGDRSRPLLYAVIDPKSEISDVAEVFHGGAIDYVGKQVVSLGIVPGRIERAAAYAEKVLELRDAAIDQRESAERPKHGQDSIGGIALSTPSVLIDRKRAQAPDTRSYRFSGSDWDQIAPESEYTFWMAYVSFNPPKEMAGRQSTQHSEHLLSVFQQAMLRYLEPAGGKVWMWQDLSGLVLFPFDGQGYAPLLAIYRLILNYNLVNAEDLDQSVPIPFHVSLDIGNSPYRLSGQTGTIIADSVNFIFHLGKKFAPEQGLTITGNVLHLVPERMMPLAQSAGKFEGRNIYTIRVPSPA
ncbi:MAG TPA: hypothetical protein VMW87_16145 [Spirochaetia bacterium]|nr:hypothetical protein [Spirochaetia bacterium]